MIRRWAESQIRRLKQDPTYVLAPGLSDRALLEVLRHRGFQALRGQWLAFRVGSAKTPIFCGSRVRLRHGSTVSLGQGTTIGDDVVIDGLGQAGVRLGRAVTIGRGSSLVCTGVISRLGHGIAIGDRTGLNEYVHVGGQGGVTIGADVMIGPGVRIFSENHRFDGPEGIRSQGEERAAVVIDDDCWIGSGALILAGVHIGRGTVVGAGSVVTRSLPAYTVAVGNPAKVVRSRLPSDDPGPDGADGAVAGDPGPRHPGG